MEAQSLRVHPTAQRELVPVKLRRLEKEFDLDAIGVLQAVEYEIDGERAIWLIDGQHRWYVLISKGFGEWIVQVEIHLNIRDDARAAALFLKLNDRASVHPFDKFKAARSSGDSSAVGIAALVEDRGLVLDRKSKDGYVCCVSSLRTVYQFDQGGALEATMDTIIAAWGGTAAACEGRIIEGLGLFYSKYNGAVDRSALVKKLAKYQGGPCGLLGDAKGLREFRHSSVARCVTERIVQTYNAGRTTGRLDPI